MEGKTMDSMDAAKRLQEEFGCDWSEARKAVESEADEIKDRLKPQRISYPDAIDSGYAAVRDWILIGHTYSVSLDWQDLARFHSSHRFACVWAVLFGKHVAAKSLQSV
jgi:hypothetical protein